MNKQYYQLGHEKIEVWKILTHQPSIDNRSHSSANKTFPCFLWRQLNSKTLKFNLTTKCHRSSKFNSTNWIADFAYKSGSPHNLLKTLMSVAQFLLPYDGMLVHGRFLQVCNVKTIDQFLFKYTWVDRGTVTCVSNDPAQVLLTS